MSVGIYLLLVIVHNSIKVIQGEGEPQSPKRKHLAESG